ncbi:hypothetical protein OS31_07760 [Dickeya oryzae]
MSARQDAVPIPAFFSRIYAELAVPVIITQRESQHSQSTVAARVALSREFVDFFEVHLPVLLTSLFSVSGAVLMLMVIEFWAGFFLFGDPAGF